MNITALIMAAALPLFMQAPSENPASTETQGQSEAAAPSSESEVELTEEEKKAHAKQMRCKMTKIVNSRIPQRICATNEEWESQERTMREQRAGTLNRNSQCSTTVRC